MIFSAGTTRVTVRLGHRGALGLIEKTPGVCGGSARVVRTRIPVWVIEGYRQLGVEPAGILEMFPTLRAVDVDAALGYARLHPQEIATEIAENESA